MSLVIGGVTIRVSSIDEPEPYRVGGGYARAADGTPVSQQRGVKRVMRYTTVFLDATSYATVRARLDMTASQTVSGDYAGGITSGYTRVLGVGWGPDGTAARRAIRFELLQA